jgi:hypothetical protein
MSIFGSPPETREVASETADPRPWDVRKWRTGVIRAACAKDRFRPKCDLN